MKKCGWILLLLALTGCAHYGAPPPPAVAVSPVMAPTPEAQGFSLVAGGDVLPGAHLEPYLKTRGPDYPFQALAPIFRQHTVGLVNLESPLSRRGRAVKQKTYTFCSDPGMAPAMRAAGISAVALGNNHILDFGPDALADTLEALAFADIAYAGAGPNLAAARAPAWIALPQGRRLALLSYSLTYPHEFWAGRNKPGTVFPTLEEISEDIRVARSHAVAVVVCFHWGAELKNFPKPYQIRFGRAAIAAGAAVVFGTHPHVLQGVERYGSGWIFYSLGNLAFGGGKSRKAVESALARMEMTASGKIVAVEMLPMNVDNLATAFVPTPAAGTAGQTIMEHLQVMSRAWGTRFVAQTDSPWYRVE